MNNTNNEIVIIKAGPHEVNIVPMLEFIGVYGDVDEISEHIETFIDTLLPFSKEAFESCTQEVLYSLSYVNELKKTFRQMKVKG